MQRNAKLYEYVQRRKSEGCYMFALCGGRRSGKTFFICQELLLNAYQFGDVVNVASMTNEQGRLGAYADCKTIISGEPALQQYLDVLVSPKEIRCKHNSGVLFFNSYQNSETAKGVACDYLFVNEANNFSKQQVTDLMANVRKGIFFDFNPNVKFWIDDYFRDDEICHSTWKDNVRFLTKLQLEYFETLKRLGDRPDANAVDRRNYLVYYEGVYSELSGDIFTQTNIKTVDAVPEGVTLRDFAIFADPSALRGADWFAMVLSAKGSDGSVYILDTFSRNVGTKELMARKIRQWCGEWDVNENIYIETNGIIGLDFYDFCNNSDLPIRGWNSRGKKFERILANFENITNVVYFVSNDELKPFLEQVYEFNERCEHDDNIDAVSSSVSLQLHYL